MILRDESMTTFEEWNRRACALLRAIAYSSLSLLKGKIWTNFPDLTLLSKAIFC
jgi:hypothetical protein